MIGTEPVWTRTLRAIPAEWSGPATRVVGAVPPWLRGSYYLNGPARFSRGDLRYQHWLDGDGMVCALHFRDDGVHGTPSLTQLISSSISFAGSLPWGGIL